MNANEVKITECPFCKGELFQSQADEMIYPDGWRKVNVNVVECVACEFIAERVFRNGILVDANRKPVFVVNARDCRGDVHKGEAR